MDSWARKAMLTIAAHGLHLRGQNRIGRSNRLPRDAVREQHLVGVTSRRQVCGYRSPSLAYAGCEGRHHDRECAKIHCSTATDSRRRRQFQSPAVQAW